MRHGRIKCIYRYVISLRSIFILLLLCKLMKDPEKRLDLEKGQISIKRNKSSNKLNK